jgi:hypothetical protein
MVHSVCMVLIKMDCYWEKAYGSNDLAKLATIITNYTFESSFTNPLPHLEGEEVFGSMKQLVNCPPSENNDSHYPDCDIFFCPWVIIPTIVPNNVKDICMHNCPLLLVICYLWYLEVAWNWRKIFVLMASGILNNAHPILQLNVLHSIKPLGSNAKQVSTFTNL